jgi:tRNA (guanine-N7-)-methyltransferase
MLTPLSRLTTLTDLDRTRAYQYPGRDVKDAVGTEGERKRRASPYENAPRLPDADFVDVRALVRGVEIELEIGPGPKAGFLVERAAAAPENGLVGLEIRRKWASVGDARLAKLGHASRARVFCEDARRALERLGPDASVARVFLHFPDPWWKKRHQKRLVMGGVFLDEVARLLAPGGHLFVQTDVEERAALYADVVSMHRAFEPDGASPGSPAMDENPYGARSPREHRAIADGLPVYRLRWRRA